MQFIRNVPEGERYDLIVCGAGPGGVGAAIAAARLGKRVLLLDGAGCLGGYWTSGLMGISLDMHGKGGLPLEIARRLLADGDAEWVNARDYAYAPEALKLLLETLAQEAGVQVLLYTRVTAVQVENRRITAILADGMAEATALSADFFVDGTGHGTLASLAGCGYDLGYGAERLQQPASLDAVVTGVPEGLWQNDVHNRRLKMRLRDMLLEGGVDCSYPAPLLFRLAPRSPLYKFAVNHQYGVDAHDPQTLTSATLEARREVNRAVAALRRRPCWEGFTLVQTAETIELRDSRRIHGLAQVTIHDALSGRHFADGIAPVHFSIDVHKLAPDYQPSEDEKSLRAQPFEIPMGSLIARDIDNLFLVGRCISGDFLTHSAYRTVCTACAIGEAAGIAAAALPAGARAADTDGAAVRRELIQRAYRFDD